jgi:hypothetical protein
MIIHKKKREEISLRKFQFFNFIFKFVKIYILFPKTQIKYQDISIEYKFELFFFC